MKVLSLLTVSMLQLGTKSNKLLIETSDDLDLKTSEGHSDDYGYNNDYQAPSRYKHV